MLETNKKNAIQKPIVYSTVGKSSKPASLIGEDHTQSSQASWEGSDTGSESDSSDSREPTVFADPDKSAPAKKQRNRWAEKICFHCKQRLGPTFSLRIGNNIMRPNVQYDIDIFQAVLLRTAQELQPTSAAST